jgi:two-component system, OmpR family, manganese sensing response regulator
MAKILLAEDDAELAPMIKDWLGFERHTVEVAVDGPTALQLALDFQFDLIILDWGLPGLTGLDICKKLRSRGRAIAILMLTGKDTVQDKETGLDAGADDYVTKPFQIKELAARVRALLRRPVSYAGSVLTAGPITLDSAGYRVSKNGVEIHLLPREFALLEFLMKHPNHVFSLEALLESVWASEDEVTPEAVRTCVTRLRRKLDVEGQASIIESVHGCGYRLCR